MEENKENEIKEIYNNLNEGNKDILNMVAKGMEIAQETKGKGE